MHWLFLSDSNTGYHQNKEHWNTIILDGSIPENEIQRMISESYDLITDNPTKRIYEAVKKIPKGHVATYGKVVEMAGDAKMARAVGNALHKNSAPEHIPCFRVVNSKGELAGAFAFGGESMQAELLEADGVEEIWDITKKYKEKKNLTYRLRCGLRWVLLIISNTILFLFF